MKLTATKAMADRSTVYTAVLSKYSCNPDSATVTYVGNWLFAYVCHMEQFEQVSGMMSTPKLWNTHPNERRTPRSDDDSDEVRRNQKMNSPLKC